MISWISRKQVTVALSLVAAEYMVTNFASCEVIWLCKLIAESIDRMLEPIMDTVTIIVVLDSLRI